MTCGLIQYLTSQQKTTPMSRKLKRSKTRRLLTGQVRSLVSSGPSLGDARYAWCQAPQYACRIRGARNTFMSFHLNPSWNCCKEEQPQANFQQPLLKSILSFTSAHISIVLSLPCLRARICNGPDVVSRSHEPRFRCASPAAVRVFLCLVCLFLVMVAYIRRGLSSKTKSRNKSCIPVAIRIYPVQSSPVQFCVVLLQSQSSPAQRGYSIVHLLAICVMCATQRKA
ncbi:hypothetical protein V1517DRAFT_187229 [Lipomyces orientalis]|uniref:Uncharacterized protein n=1 Tax=Lipomyces orientalis TaxID=1233043 RepID=A0ACC3TIF1_9ASCO